MTILEDYYVCREAARVITHNSGHPVSPMYVVRLTTLGILTPINVGGRHLYPKNQVEGIRVREKNQSRKAGKVA
jgi:hypothetical protein